MLRRILWTLRQGGQRSCAELASQLGIGEDVLRHMLAQLESMGYLRAEDGSCTGMCRSCAPSRECPASKSGRLWVLTEKGSRATAAS